MLGYICAAHVDVVVMISGLESTDLWYRDFTWLLYMYEYLIL